MTDPVPSNSLLTELLDVLRSYHDGRCFACGWSLAAEQGKGCIPGDCSYRPPQVHPSYKQWRERMEVMTRVQHAITHPLQCSGHEPPAAPAKMRISYQPQGRCLWHEDCEKSRSGIMRVVSKDTDRSLLECLHCQQRGYYPVGAVGSLCVDVVGSSQPPRDGWNAIAEAVSNADPANYRSPSKTPRDAHVHEWRTADGERYECACGEVRQ
jgi:hypothetical protein